LKASLSGARNEWGSFEFPEIDAIPEHEVSKLQAGIKKLLNDRKEATENPTKWETCKGIAENVFIAMSPFAKHFLTVAKEAQSVNKLQSFESDRRYLF
jgi:hypothetical protein